MNRVSLAVVLAFLATGCSSSPAPTPAVVNPTFTAQLLSANETPPITNGESVASGNVTITFVTTKDATGNVTSAVGTAVVNLQGFLLPDSSITLAHIHTGAVGVKGGVLINFIPSGPVPLTNGAGTFTQTTNIGGSDATNIMTNPAGFYFNVHTSVNAGGAIRGQLVRTQ